MDEWMDKWMDERMDEWMDGLLSCISPAATFATGAFAISKVKFFFQFQKIDQKYTFCML